MSNSIAQIQQENDRLQTELIQLLFIDANALKPQSIRKSQSSVKTKELLGIVPRSV